MYLSIDPGESSGWALWSDRKLSACGAGDFLTLRLMLSTHRQGISAAVIELPQVYARKKSKGDPNDLIRVGVQVGRYVESLDRLGCKVLLVHPHDWKGTIEKAPHHAQIWASLGPAEQEIVRRNGTGLGAKALSDLMDSVGLGKWAWRMNKWPV